MSLETYDRNVAPFKMIKSWMTKNINDFKHYENYNNLDFNNEHIALSVMRSDESIAGFSTIQSRTFYPAETYRILSRFFVDYNHRIGGGKTSVLSERCQEMVEHQMDHLQNINAKVGFITLHSWKPRWCNMFISELNKRTSYHWYQKDLVLVAPDPSSPKCYQHVIYTKLSDSDAFSELLDTTISYNDWSLL